jgi:hypothetical protein
MFKHFRILPFLFGVVIGIVGIYFAKPQETVIMKYPTPENSGKITYRDKNGVCYTYDAKQVECDKNEHRLKTYPLA